MLPVDCQQASQLLQVLPHLQHCSFYSEVQMLTLTFSFHFHLFCYLNYVQSKTTSFAIELHKIWRVRTSNRSSAENLVQRCEVLQEQLSTGIDLRLRCFCSSCKMLVCVLSVDQMIYFESYLFKFYISTHSISCQLISASLN